jgi:hypothetical protein
MRTQTHRNQYVEKIILMATLSLGILAASDQYSIEIDKKEFTCLH